MDSPQGNQPQTNKDTQKQAGRSAITPDKTDQKNAQRPEGDEANPQPEVPDVWADEKNQKPKGQ